MKWQGERTFADYWATEPEPKAAQEPYFRRAGTIYVEAAKLLGGNDKSDLTAEEKTARLSTLAKLEADLAADDTFVVSAGARLPPR